MKYKQVESSVSCNHNENHCLVVQKPITHNNNNTNKSIKNLAPALIPLPHEHKTIKRENLFAWHRRFVFLLSFVFIWLLLSSYSLFFFFGWSQFLGCLVLKSNVLSQYMGWLSISFDFSSSNWAKGYVERPIRVYLFCLPFHIHTYIYHLNKFARLYWERTKQTK